MARSLETDHYRQTSMPVETQFDELQSKDKWDELSFELQAAHRSTIFTELSTSEASRSEHASRNRYRNILPYNHSRVLLKPCQTKSSDYINACSVNVPDANRSYICSQGPLLDTVNHFWEMCWINNTRAIVRLNNVKDCATYLPVNLGSSLTVEDSDHCHEFCVTLIKEELGPVFIVRELRVTRRPKDCSDDVEERSIMHFQFINWPDFGVPRCPDEFLDFLWAFRRSGCLDAQPDKEHHPVVVHCTAGVGRTGSFVLIDVCLSLLSLHGDPEILTELLELRTMRMGLVETAAQLKFCFQAIIQGKTRLRTELASKSYLKQKPGEV